jgi:hypothetical protein
MSISNGFEFDVEAGMTATGAAGVVVVVVRVEAELAGFVVRVRVRPPVTLGVGVVEAGVDVEVGKEAIAVGVVDPRNPDQNES